MGKMRDKLCFRFRCTNGSFTETKKPELLNPMDSSFAAFAK
jgi:hypothetical protein